MIWENWRTTTDVPPPPPNQDLNMSNFCRIMHPLPRHVLWLTFWSQRSLPSFHTLRIRQTWPPVTIFPFKNLLSEQSFYRTCLWQFYLLAPDSNSWTLISEKIAYTTFFTVRILWQYLGVWHFIGPYSVANLLLWFKIIHPGLITIDYIIKYIYILGTFWETFLPLLQASSFAHPLTIRVIILHLSF